MRKLLLSFLLLFLALSLQAQPRPTRPMMIRSGGQLFSVNVAVADSLSGEPVSFASVYLKPAKDTIITNFTLTDASGKAVLDMVTRGAYTLNVEMMGYLPYRKDVYFSSRTDVGTVRMVPDPKTLAAATVTAAAVPMQMVGDTLVYNAAAFSVRDNDMLKDLLKKMPGMEVGDDGSVKVNGESVTRITVNGRTFFTGSNQAALDNLPAKAVEQIKVMDRESDMAAATGIRSGAGTKRKSMDVSLKQEYKNGVFGNVRAHGGSSIPSKDQDELLAAPPFLWNASGMLSFFGEKDQATLIARGENVDAGTRFRPSSGLMTGGQAGVNLTTDRIKNFETSANVYYNGSSRENASRSTSLDYPASGEEVSTERTSSSGSTSDAFNLGLSLRGRRLRGMLFNFDPKISYSGRTSTSASSSASSFDGVPTNSSQSLSSSHSREFSSSGNLAFVYSRFKKEGRNLSLNANYSVNSSKGKSKDWTSTVASGVEQLRDLTYDNDGSSGSLSMSAAYVDALTEKLRIRGGLTGSWTRSNSSKDAFNADGSANEYYSSLSRNNSLTGRGALLLQYEWDRTHYLQAGASVSADQTHTFSRTQGTESDLGQGEWLWNWAPELNVVMNSFSLRYEGRSSQPRHNQMLSYLDITNPLRVSTGNIYLKPSFAHSVTLRQSFGEVAIGGMPMGGRGGGSRRRGGLFNINLTFALTQNKTVVATWYDPSRIRYSVPVNTRRPGLQVNALFNGSSELGKGSHFRIQYDLDLNFNQDVNYQAKGALSLVDSQNFDYAQFMAAFWGNSSGDLFYSGASGFQESLTRRFSYNPRIDLVYFSDAFLATLSNSLNGQHAWYSLDGSADSHTHMYRLSLDVTYNTPHQFHLGGYYSFNRYFGYADGFANSTHTLNLNLSKDIRAFTISLQAMDLLNRGIQLSHSVSETGVTDSYSLSLGRHFLLGVTWNFGRMSARKVMTANQSSRQIMNTLR